MTVHIVKLCVGVDTVDDLERWIEHRRHLQAMAGEARRAYSHHPYDAQASGRNSRWWLALLGHKGNDPGARANHRFATSCRI